MKKLINICGTARSGSTMIDLILGNDNKGFSLGEINALYRPYRTHHFEARCSCNNEECPWKELKSFSEKDFYVNAFKVLNVEFLVDSSKEIPWVIDNNINARENGFQVFNILVYKDPISFFYSFWKRGFDIEAVRQREYLKYYRRFFQTRLPYIALNYNEFIENPQKNLYRLCTLLDIPYFDGKENFWEKQHHHLFGSKGVRAQAEKGQSEIKKQDLFPDEFKKLIPQIIQGNESDENFQRILQTLQMHHLCPSSEKLKESIQKPTWYYLSKFKRKFQKWAPEKWHYDQ